MASELPQPSSTTEVYLAAVVDRLDALLEALKPEPAPRKRTPRKTT